jgi:hypothetical protein
MKIKYILVAARGCGRSFSLIIESKNNLSMKGGCNGRKGQ